MPEPIQLRSHQVLSREVFPADGERNDPAEEFHCASRLEPVTAGAQMSGVITLASSPQLQLRTRHAWRRKDPSAQALPEPRELPSGLSMLWQNRRSRAAFAPKPIALSDCGTVLYAANGLIDRPSGRMSRRTAPSGGALYPLDIYLLARNVSGAEGLYYYHPQTHSLSAINIVNSQPWDGFIGLPAEAAAVMIIAGNFWRSRFKYGQRGYRFALLEAGQAQQNGILAATAMELGACPWGAFYDDALDRALELDGVNQGVLATVALGQAQ